MMFYQKKFSTILIFLFGIVTSYITSFISYEGQKYTKKENVILSHVNTYCNRLDSIIDGVEGEPLELNHTLVSAVILIRHGDRLAMSRPTTCTQLTQDNCNLSTQDGQLNNLKIFLKVNEKRIRSGINKDLNHFPLFPDLCSNISISKVGLLQVIKLGKYLRKKYISPYKELQNVSVSTSRTSRTFQSLLAFLYSFSSKFNTISSSSEIYFCDSDLDRNHVNLCQCEKMHQIRTLRAGFRNWNLTEKNVKHLYKILQIENGAGVSSTDGPTYNIASPSRIWDWLVSEYYCPRRKLPCIADRDGVMTCLNSSVLEALLSSVVDNHLKMVSDYNYLEATSLAMFPFLKAVAKIFQSRSSMYSLKPNLPVDLHIYSTHDITIGPLFNALGIPVFEKVPYASRVVFELWHSPKLDYYFKLLFNGDDITQRVPFCTNSVALRWQFKSKLHSTETHYCTLHNLTSFLSSSFFNEMTAKDFISACRL